MAIIAIEYLIVYIVAYDKSYYHIDTVREPMIEFLFMEAMLVGAWFRHKDEIFRNKFHWYVPVITVAIAALYFTSKFLFSKYDVLSIVQPINQLFLLIALFFVFWTFSSLDGKLEKMPKWIKITITFISEMTLEIYVVQYVLIDLIRGLNIVFPLNWFTLVAVIIAGAAALHYICKVIMFLVDLLISKIKKKEDKVIQ